MVYSFHSEVVELHIIPYLVWYWFLVSKGVFCTGLVLGGVTLLPFDILVLVQSIIFNKLRVMVF